MRFVGCGYSMMSEWGGCGDMGLVLGWGFIVCWIIFVYWDRNGDSGESRVGIWLERCCIELYSVIVVK